MLNSKKLVNLFLASLSLILIKVLLSPHPVYATMASVNCDDGETLLFISNVNPPFNWLISTNANPNNKADVFFQSHLAIPNDEISMKLGNSGWVTPVNSMGDHMVYEYYFDVGNERCGYVWGNVRWRSATDGQLHYCNLKMPKYDTGNLVSNFVNSSCITTTCTYTDNPLARAVYVTGAITASGCAGSNVYLNSVAKNFSSCSWNEDFQRTATNGVVELYVSPQPSGGFTTAQANAQTYNYINEASCGGPITPIPTPTVKNICSKVTGYVKNSVTKLGVKGAKVTAHGIDNSIGNCQGKHYACGTATTNANGYFEISCTNVSDANTKCLGVYETQNAPGYIDAYGAIGPTGSSVWDNNTIMLNNPQTSTCGTFNFFDKK